MVFWETQCKLRFPAKRYNVPGFKSGTIISLRPSTFVVSGWSKIDKSKSGVASKKSRESGIYMKAPGWEASRGHSRKIKFTEYLRDKHTITLPWTGWSMTRKQWRQKHYQRIPSEQHVKIGSQQSSWSHSCLNKPGCFFAECFKKVTIAMSMEVPTKSALTIKSNIYTSIQMKTSFRIRHSERSKCQPSWSPFSKKFR